MKKYSKRMALILTASILGCQITNAQIVKGQECVEESVLLQRESTELGGDRTTDSSIIIDKEDSSITTSSQIIVVGDMREKGEVSDIHEAISKANTGDVIRFNKDVQLTEKNRYSVNVDKSLVFEGSGHRLDGEISLNRSDLKVVIKDLKMRSENVGEGGVTTCVNVGFNVKDSKLEITNCDFTASNTSNYSSAIRIDGNNVETVIDGCRLTGPMGIYVNNFRDATGKFYGNQKLTIKGATEIYSYMTNPYTNGQKGNIWGGTGVDVEAYDAILNIENVKIRVAEKPGNDAPYYPTVTGIRVKGKNADLKISNIDIKSESVSNDENCMWVGKGVEILGDHAAVMMANGAIESDSDGISIRGNEANVNIADGTIQGKNNGIYVLGNKTAITMESGKIEGHEKYGIYIAGKETQADLGGGIVNGYNGAIMLDDKKDTEISDEKPNLGIKTPQELIEILGEDNATLSTSEAGIPTITLKNDITIPEEDSCWEIPKLILDGNQKAIKIKSTSVKLRLYGDNMIFKNLSSAPILEVSKDKMAFTLENSRLNNTMGMGTEEYDGAIYGKGNQCTVNVNNCIIGGDGESNIGLYTGIRFDGLNGKINIVNSQIEGNFGVYVNNFRGTVEDATEVNIEASRIVSKNIEGSYFGRDAFIYDGNNITVNVTKNSILQGERKGININLIEEKGTQNINISDDSVVLPSNRQKLKKLGLSAIPQQDLSTVELSSKVEVGEQGVYFGEGTTGEYIVDGEHVSKDNIPKAKINYNDKGIQFDVEGNDKAVNIEYLQDEEYRQYQGETISNPNRQYKLKVTKEYLGIPISRQYVLKVNPIEVGNASLSNLTVNNGILTPAFNSDTLKYRVTVGNTVEKIIVGATTADEKSNVVGIGEKTLKVGDNVIEVLITAKDGVTTKTYTVVVTREATTKPSTGGGGGGGGAITPKKPVSVEDIIEKLSSESKQSIAHNLKNKMPYTTLKSEITLRQLKEATNNEFTDEQLKEMIEKPELLKKLGIDLIKPNTKMALNPIDNPNFSDVSMNYWAHDVINKAAELGLVAGMPDGSFAPTASLQIADTFTFLDRVLLLNGVEEMKLPRSTVEKYVTNREHWGFNSVASVASKLSEKTLGTVAKLGNDPISRELLAQVIYEVTNAKLECLRESVEFKDIQNSPYKEAIDYCVRTGVLSGASKDRMLPDKALTRAELMAILIRLDNLLK